MKKLLLLIFLMIFSLGYSQTLRLGFESGESGNAFGQFGSMNLPAVETGTGSNTSKVLKVVANPTGTIWQGCNFLLTSSVQLTTTKTMTIDVLSSVPITFLLKVNGGVSGAPEAAAQASHNGDGTWQTISFTFNTSLDGKAATANGVYNNMVIHPFWTSGQTAFSGSPSARTFYIDNISGPAYTPPGSCTNGIQDGTETGIDCGGTCSPCAAPAPTVAATTPVARNAWDVVSIYTDNTYADLAGTNFFPNWGQTTSLSSFAISGNNILKYSNLNYQGIEFASGIDVAAMTHIHLDFWSADCTSFQFFLIGGGENAVTLTPTLSGWNSFDIPMTSYAARTLNNIIQFKMVGTGTVFIDNIYFYRPATSLSPPTLSNFSIGAQIIGGESFTITPPTTNSSGGFTYASSNPSVATISGSTLTIVGVGSTTITATQAARSGFASGSISTILNVTPAAPTAPTNAATDVISVFSNSFTNVTGTDFYPNWSQATQYSLLDIEGNAVLKYSNLDYQGVQLASTVNASSMQNLHIDIWTPDCTTFDVYLISPGPVEQKVTVNPTLSGWNSIDIPLSSYTTINNASIGQFKFVGSGTVYLDNIYFWKAPAGSYTYYADADGDGYGAGAASISTSATAPTGFSANNTDCNDSSALAYPGATEIADGIDNDCDGAIDEGFPPSTAAPTPPARNAWDVVSLFSGAYANVTLNELPTEWSQLALAPFSVETIAGNATWKFGGEFLGMVTNYDTGIDLTSMTTMHIDYWTPDNKTMIAKIVNTISNAPAATEGLTIVQDPVVTGTWRSVDIPMSQFGTSVNKSKISQILLDPQLGGSTVYVDNLYFFRPATTAPAATLGAFTVPAKVVGDASFELTAPTSNSNGAFTYTSSNEAVATISGSTVTIVGAGTSIITATQAASGSLGSASVTANFVVSGPTISTAAPTPPARNAWDVVSVFSNAYSNVTLSELPTEWSQLSEPFETVSLEGNATWRFKGQFLGMVTNYGTGIDLTSMTTMHIDYWTPDTNRIDLKLVNTVNGGEALSALEDPTVTGTWRSIDIPLTAYGTLNRSKITQILIDPAGVSNVYIDNFYFYRPATSASPATLGAFTVPAKVVGDASFELTAPTSNSDGAFTYTSSNEAVATISGSTVTIVGAGTSIITATQAASGSLGSASVTANFVVSGPTISTAAPTPPARNAWDVVSVFTDAANYNVQGTDFFPYWSQPGGYIAPSIVQVGTTNDNTLLYQNLTYQGIVFNTPINVLSMTKLHLDVWTPNSSTLDVVLIGGGENGVVVNPTIGQWTSFDIDMSNYAGRTLNSIIQMMFRNTTPAGGIVYVDNIYYYRPATSAPPATLGAFTVPAKVVGDASFGLTAPTSNSNGAFTYTSSNEAVATISGSTVTIVGAGTSIITATQAASGSLGSASVTANFVVSGPTISTAAPTPPARNAWDVVSVYSNAYSNVTLSELPTSWSDLSEPFETVSLEGNATWRFKGQFLGMVTNYDNGIDLTSMTTMHIDYWTPDTNRIDLKLVNTLTGGEAFTALEDPTVTGTWRSIDIPLTAYGTLNRSKITQILIDPAGVSNVYIDNFYFYRPATSASPATLGAFTVPAKVVGDASFGLTAPTSNSDGAFTYTSSNEAVATISGSTVTIVGAGTSIITATQAASGSLGSASVTANFVVSGPTISTAAPTPPARNAWDVVSVFTDAANYNVQGTDFFPYWSQPGGYIAPSIVQVGTTNDNTLLYQNLTYQGIVFNTPINVLSMTKLHLDVWTPNSSTLDVVLIGGGENGVVVNPTIGQWTSFDIDMSNYAGRTLNSIIQMMFRNTTPAGGIVYVDNIYYYRPATSAPPATLGAFTVPAKVVGDASFGLTAPTSNSDGAFTYTSSNEAVATISGSTVTIVGAGTSIITATQAASGSLGSASVTANFVVSGPTISTAAPTPPARNAWDVVSVFSNAYSNVTLSELPTEWSQLSEPFETVSLEGNATWRFKGQFLGMVTNYGTGIDLTSMTTMHIDYWTPDTNRIDLKLVNTVNGGEALSALEDPTVTGTWRSIDIPLTAYGTLNRSKITQILIDPAGVSNVYIDNFYFYRPATSASPATLGAFTVPAKVVGDASFELTAPTSNSDGAFTYTSSNEAVATISGSTVTIVGAGTSIITATQAASGSLGSASVTANFVVSGPTISTAAPTPPARNAWDVVSVYSNAYSNVTLSELPTEWSQLSEPFETVSLEGNATWRFKGQFLGMVTNYGTGIDLTSMTTMHIDYWTPDTNRIDLKLVNTVNGGEALSALEDPTVTGTWRSIDIPLTAYGTLNRSKITQILIDPAGVSNVYIDNFYFYRPATSASPATLGAFTVPAKVVGDASFGLTAPTSNSDGAFTYTSSNEAVATISGSTVTIVGAGTTVITATQAASGSLGSASVTANFVVSFAPPTTAAPTPPARNAWDVVSVFTDAANYNVQGTDFFPYWGQPGGYIAPSIVQVGTTNDNTLLYQNLTYQGIVFNTPINVLSMTKLHLDVWTPNSSTLDVVLIGGGENGVVVNPTIGQWTSFDIDMSNYAGRTLNSIIQMMFRNTTPVGGIVYVDNIYYYRPATGTAFYADADGDGYGAGSAVLFDPATVGVPTGYSANNTDCVDTNAAINPGATEIFDTIDNDCDGLIDEGTTLAAPGVTNLTVCVGSPSVTLTATALSGYTLRWYATATGTTALTATPVVVTTAAIVKSFWVSQRLGTGTESARVQITVTVVALPATPGTITGTAAICNVVGSTTELTYSIAAVTGATSYVWTVPTGANILSGQGSTSVTVNFAGVAQGITALTLGVRSENATGCLSVAKTLSLTRVLPVAPASVTLTNPASATPATAITAVGPFIGTTTELTLTAAVTASANSYSWTLPAGVNVISGNPATDRVLVINFANAASGTTSITASVVSVSGCGNSIAKALVLTKVLPAKPAAITTTQTNVCLIAGSESTVTYTVVPVVGAFANGYTWTVPTGASIVGSATGNSIVVSYSSNFNAAGSVTVTSSNGVGTSATAATLAVAATAPLVPATLVMTLAPSTTAVVAAGPFMGTSTVLTLTAAPVAGAVSYAWTLPAGVNQLSGGTERIITVNFADVVTPTGITALAISVKAVNGCGLQSVAKALSLTRALPVKPAAITTTQTNVCLIAGSESTVTYTVAPVAGAFANGYTWTVPTGASIVGSATGNSIVVSYSSNFNAAGSVTVTSSNGVGTSATAATLAVAATAPLVPATLVMTLAPSTTAVVAAGPYMGTSTVLTLTAAPVAGAVSYAWTLPAGVNQVSGGTERIITVNFADVVTPTGITALVISVKAVNGCGLQSVAKALSLTRALPVKPVAITTTLANVCSIAGTNATVTYSVAPVAGAFADGYAWTVPTGGTIVSGQGTTSIAVSYAGSFTAGNVSVTSSNGVGTSLTPTTLAVARTSGAVTPATIVGQVAGLCAGTAYNYSFAAGANAQTYTITGPVGSVVTSADNASNTSNVITTSNLAFTVVYPTTAIVNISIVATNPCGSSAAKTYVVSKAMGAITAISGPTAVDTCSEYTYTATAVVGAVAYTWTVPSGAQIVSGQGTNTLVVVFPGTLATGAVLKVLATNACSVSSALKSSTVLTRTNCPAARSEVVLQEVTKTPFAVKAYPNPYSENFNLSVTTSSEDKVGIVVYDMTGRLIERRDVRPSDMVEQQIGDRYPSGVYNVVITQGQEVKTLRVIKR